MIKCYASDLQVGPECQRRPQIDVVSNLQAEVSLKFGDVGIDYTHPVGRDREN